MKSHQLFSVHLRGPYLVTLNVLFVRLGQSKIAKVEEYFTSTWRGIGISFQLAIITSR